MPRDLPVPKPRHGDRVGDNPGAPGTPWHAEPGRTIDRDLRGRCPLRVFDLSLACCAVEYLAAATGDGSTARTGFEVLGAEPFAPGPEAANVLVVSGTVTEALAPAVRAAYEALQEPRYVVSFGACSSTGGPYWDSYSVVAGVDQLVPVDSYVPGCPPRPEALVDALAQLQDQLVRASAG